LLIAGLLVQGAAHSQVAAKTSATQALPSAAKNTDLDDR